MKFQEFDFLSSCPSAESSKLAACQRLNMVKILFFFSLFIVFYSYVGYGIVIYLLVTLKHLFSRRRDIHQPVEFEPEITLIVAAYNEAGLIENKIANSLNLKYPSGKLHWIFVTDGSTDETPEIVSRFSQIRLLHQPERKGKAGALNRAMKFVETPFVIFSDSNTQLNPEAVQEIVKHYTDALVGGVAGEKKIVKKIAENAAASGEGFYWRYESQLKKLDSAFYSVVGAAGELFSLRTSLYQEAAEDTIIEDFVLSLQICMAGFVIRYEPKAYALESASISMQEEHKRKVRIAAGAFQAMQMLKGLFNVFRFPVLAFQFVSHRILRWTFCPLCLIICFFTNAVLVYDHSGRFYTVVFLCQTVFYAMAFYGWVFANMHQRAKLLYVPYYFLFMNLSMFLGFYRFLRNKQSSVWEKAKR